MADEDERRIWRGAHPLRGWMLMWTSWLLPPRHPKDQARRMHGKHTRKAERMHNVKRR